MLEKKILFNPKVIEDERYPKIDKILSYIAIILGLFLIFIIGIGIPYIIIKWLYDIVIEGFLNIHFRGTPLFYFYTFTLLITSTVGGWLAVNSAKALFETLRFYKTYELPESTAKNVGRIIVFTKIPIICHFALMIYIPTFIYLYYKYGEKKN